MKLDLFITAPLDGAHIALSRILVAVRECDKVSGVIVCESWQQC
jgi:hypothetical protein